MGAYKKLNKQDVYISTHTAHKTWIVNEAEFSNYGITTITATGSYLSSIQQLYYPSKSQGSIVAHSHDYYNQTTLYKPQSRNINTTARIISIPRSLFGSNIQANSSISFTIGSRSAGLYVTGGYWTTGYADDSTIEGNWYITDDGEGTLYASGSLGKSYIGDVIYPHGVVVLSDSTVDSIDYLSTDSIIRSLKFNSSHPIYTHNYHCRVRESEFNFTNNPSALSGSLKTTYDNEGNIYSTTSNVSDGVLKNNVTGSTFQPYITTVGLYNDANQLIAVGKMSQPIPKSANTEMTIIVKIDI